MELQIPISLTFAGKNSGPALLVFGAIHGNEPCGPLAIGKIIKEIESDNLILQKGKVTFVPVCNPKAYGKNVRFVEENLNRVFKKWETPKSYEQGLSNGLTKLIDECDVFLDIHSMTAESEPTVFIDFPNQANIDLAEIVRCKYALLDWPNLYQRDGQGIISYDTTAYANSVGKTGILVECGQHNNPTSVDVAYLAIINSLKHLGLISGTAQKFETKKIKMEKIVLRKHMEDSFKKEWRHLDTVRQGQIIGTRKTGEEIRASSDCVMLLPNKDACENAEWFYLGKFC